jgi:cystathionine gamma-synthase
MPDDAKDDLAPWDGPDVGMATRAVHAGTGGEQPGHAITVPVYQTATYSFRDTAALHAHMHGDSDRFEYGRYGNPTLRAAELKIAALEGADDALLFASGMAAVTVSLLALLSHGQHIVMTDDCYKRTRQFVTQILGRMGVEVTLVAADDLAAIAAAIRPKQTRVLLTESPTNPYLQVVDLEALAALKRSHRFKILVDATFATPVNQQPLAQGADLVIHSATKYLAGHNDVLCGVIAGSQHLVGLVRDLQAVLGAVLDPQAAYLLIRGLKTLPLRVRAQNATALRLARTLSGHPKVARVYYPGLETHPTHAVARRLMSGFGGVVSFELRGDLEATSRFIDHCRLFTMAPSLGGVESLIIQVALVSYYHLAPEERAAIGISESLVRASIGLEDADDLERDLLQALAAV